MVFVLLGQVGYAQTHYNVWLRMALGLSLAKRVVAEEEFQYRRQNGFGNSCILDKPLLYSWRSWIHYEASEHVKFSVSPFAYFSHYPVIESRADAAKGSQGELRFTVAGEVQGKLRRKLVGMGRSALEYRMLEKQGERIVRWRNRLGVAYDFGERVRLGLYDEGLLNVAGRSGAGFFDQHRLGLNCMYKLAPRFKMEVGYLWSVRESSTVAELSGTHHLVLHFSYRLRE